MHQLTSFGLLLRYWTKICLNLPCGILIPLTVSSWSDKAWNMQFPNPSLSVILKPLSDAIFLCARDRSILLLTLLASGCICWSSWMTRSREPRRDKVFINLTAWKKRNNRLLEDKSPKPTKRNFEVKRKRRASTNRLPLFCPTTQP